MIDLSSNHQERIEKRLEPVTFILSKGLMITYVSRESNLVERLIEKHGSELRHFEDIIAFATLMIYTHYINGLKEIKKQIDQLMRLPVKQPKIMNYLIWQTQNEIWFIWITR